MRVCWNRQTGTFEGRVSKDVWVQVPLLAPSSLPFGRELFLYTNSSAAYAAFFLLHKKRTLPYEKVRYLYRYSINIVILIIT